jgi:SAM-dependent methyltransferase
MMSSLLIGCGSSRIKKVHEEGQQEWVGPLTTLDMNPNCGADVVWDMETRPLPFSDESFDEIGAYDVLEHWGKQGDWRGFFDEMAEYHRLLKPRGVFRILVPIGQDALADPGHIRFFHQNYFAFLTKAFYEENAGKPITDYRWYIKTWWTIRHLQKHGNHHLSVILEKA